MNTSFFHTLIGTTHNITWWQMMIRGVLVFSYGLLIVRFAGRRMFGKHTALDIIISVLVGSNLSRALTGNAPFFPTLMATAVIVFVYWLLVYGAVRVRMISWLAKGRPVQLMHDGEIDREKIKKMGVGERDLAEAMRASGANDFCDVKDAWLERDGGISIVRK